MCRHLLAVAIVGWSVLGSHASAAIVDVLRYRLGEPGSFSGQLPLDADGTKNMTGSLGSYTPGAVTDTWNQAYSTNATRFGASALSGTYGATSDGLPTNNFGLEFWVRTSNPGQATTNFIAMDNGVTGSIYFTGGNNVWAASLVNVGWLGAASGAGQTAVANEWTNLAIIRDAGTSTLYINGVAQAGTLNNTPVFGTSGAGLGIHVAVQPGGGTYFDGDIDEIRMYTFDPLTDDPVAALSINAVPEPASLAAAVASLAGLALWRQRRQVGS